MDQKIVKSGYKYKQEMWMIWKYKEHNFLKKRLEN